MWRFLRIVGYISLVGLFLALAGTIGAGVFFWHLARDLPSYESIVNHEPAIMSRVYAADGHILAEYARERRIFTPIERMPRLVPAAFLAAEDKDFFAHAGLDARAIARSVFVNIGNALRGRRLVGGSTITQQVARNFLLTQDVTITRKIKEALLALRLERALPKERILELYLNKIYMGGGSYGVGAAALTYFNKTLPELDTAEIAYLAALPKGPNNYHPLRHRARAVARRNWVLSRMRRNGVISEEEARTSMESDLTAAATRAPPTHRAAYFVKDARAEAVRLYGEEALYEGGLAIRGTLDTRLQTLARRALREGLVAYDLRHGWRGPIATRTGDDTWEETLGGMEVPPNLAPWRLAVVLARHEGTVFLGLRQAQGKPYGDFALLPAEYMRFAEKGSTDMPPMPGDVVYATPVPEAKPRIWRGTEEWPVRANLPVYALRQIPKVNGGIVAMDPHTGRVLAMHGGFGFALSQFNRASQAWRQPGSAFKPFVYAAALDNGFTPASTILDAPFVAERGADDPLWKPTNYGSTFYDRATLRTGLEKSRNLMTVRLAQLVGMDKIIPYAKKFGLVHDVRPDLSVALGSQETTLLLLTSAYAMIVNGGRRVEPALIERIQDRRGNTIYRRDRRACWECADAAFHKQAPPDLPDTRDRILSAQTAYQLVSMLEGVVARGTGWRARGLGRPIGGKTGTTNKARDAWFVGFAPDLVVGVYVGFDTPAPLGDKETGGRIAAPIFAAFMRAALGEAPATPFRVPPGISLVRIHADTGRPAERDDGGTLWEAFKAARAPRFNADFDKTRDEAPPPNAITTAKPEEKSGHAPSSGTGGLY